MAKVDRGLGRYLARSSDVDLDPILDQIADEIEVNAIGLAAEHIKSGDYVDSIHTTVDKLSPSGRDRIVYSDDPDALAIEFGHLSGSRTSESRTPVAGQHILGRAADAVREAT
jgi:hypothetical protein